MHYIAFFAPDSEIKITADAGDVLLETLLAAGIPIRHDCGGICHCTTCHVYIEKGEEHLEEPSRREIAFLKKVPERKPSSRLSCQCLFKKGKGVLLVRLPPNAKRPGNK